MSTMSRGGGAAAAYYWKTQLPVDYIDTSLVQDAWETVNADLSDGMPARLWLMHVRQVNNGAAVETIELELTLNGVATLWTLTGIANNTRIYCYFGESLSAGSWETKSGTTASVMGSARSDSMAIPGDFESVGLIRVRQTSTVDATSASIEVNLTWEKLTRYP